MKRIILNISRVLLLMFSGCASSNSASAPPEKSILRSPDYVEILSQEEALRTKGNTHIYQGNCLDHGEVTNASTDFEKVLAAVDAHNEHFHKGQVPKAVIDESRPRRSISFERVQGGVRLKLGDELEDD